MARRNAEDESMKKRWLFATLSLFLVQTAIYGDELAHLFERGSTYFKAGEFKQAVSYFEKAKEKAPSGLKKDIISYNLATSYLKSGQYLQAVEAFTEVYGHRERQPSYLVERSTHNYILAGLEMINQTLLQESDEITLEILTQAKEKLKQIEEVYSWATQSLESFQYKQEEFHINSAIKEAHSKINAKLDQLKLDGLSLASVLEKIRSTLLNQTLFYERIGLKELKPSACKYFLNRQFVEDQKLKPLWQRLEDLAEEKTKADSEELFHKLKAQIRESFNEYLASLDCLRENQLWLGRFKSAKSKILLDLVDLQLKQEDIMKYCLQKRIEINLRKTQSNGALANSLQRELHWMNSLSHHLCEQFLETMVKNSEAHLAPMVALGHHLKERLKTAKDQPGYLKDFYIYQQMMTDPVDILYPIYQKLDEKKKDLEKEQTAFIAQLEVASLFFELQKETEDESLQRKVKRALESLGQALTTFREQTYERSHEHLEDFFTHYHFSRFMFLQAHRLSEYFEQILNNRPFRSEIVHEVYPTLIHIDQLCSQSDLSAEDFVLQNQLRPGFEEAVLSLKLEQEIKKEDQQKVLVQNAYHWMKRIQEMIEKEIHSSEQILKKGILEQKLALELAKIYPELKDISSLSDKAILRIIINSEKHPIEAVSSFETLYYQEKAGQDLKKKSTQDEVIQLFHEGLKQARIAQKTLQSSAIDWEKVFQNEQGAIECWEKIFSKDSSKDSSMQENSSTDSPSSDSGELSQNQMDNNQEGDINKNQEQIPHQPSQNSIMGILEKLSEMQQDDKLIEKGPKKAKEGLRPW